MFIFTSRISIKECPKYTSNFWTHIGKDAYSLTTPLYYRSILGYVEASNEEEAVQLLKERFNFRGEHLVSGLNNYKLVGCYDDETF